MAGFRETVRRRPVSRNYHRREKKNDGGITLLDYGILGSDSGDDDEPDEEGSRAVASRTYIGIRSAFGKEYPWTLEPLRLLWGLVVIEEYVYRCVLSNAKISLMISDLPHIEYKKEKKQGYTKKDYDEAVVANQEIHRKYLAMKEAEKGKEIDLTKLIQSA